MDAVSIASRQPLLTNKRILVVEDEFLVSMMLESELAERGAMIAGSAALIGDALRVIEEAISEGGLHAAVLDLNLHGEAVLPVAARLAALGVPFVFVTGYDQGCDRGGHCAPMLQKPFQMEALITALERVASRSR
jgi:DNA-binding response OmpR family regulator